MKILIVSDAWYPQVNGVVRTLEQTITCLKSFGHTVVIVHPGMFRTVSAPTYPEIRLAVAPSKRMAKIISDEEPDSIHIATEGPLGLAARNLCVQHDWSFTTSYHTRFPDYLKVRFGIPRRLTYSVMRWFHEPADTIMVNTPSMMEELLDKKFGCMALWSRGVDLSLFRRNPDALNGLRGTDPDHADWIASQTRPIAVYVGRVSPEKNLEAFLRTQKDVAQLVVGDGPSREKLEATFPDARFVGFKSGQDLVNYLSASDMFVFPSKSDTFGLVMIEAMACGLPVAAYRVQGPQDIIREGVSGYLADDLNDAIEWCRWHIVKNPRYQIHEDCAKEAAKFSWTNASRQFERNLSWIDGGSLTGQEVELV